MIFSSFSPNTESDDIRRAFFSLVRPWTWKRGAHESELRDHTASFLNVPAVSLFESGRTSLYAALKAIGIGPGDEVLIQAYTCVAVPEPILWLGARPVYVDCNIQTLTMNAGDLATKITTKSKAVVIQHTFGAPADVDAIMAVARKNDLVVIEDCAHALGAEYKGKKVGALGDISFGSFGRDKVISSIFGGFTATSKRDLGEKIEKIRDEFSYPRSRWISQQLSHPIIVSFSKFSYNFLSLGKVVMEVSKRLGLISVAVESVERKGGRPSFAFKKMPNALAGLALAQFKKLERFNARRKDIARMYETGLKNVLPNLPWVIEGTAPIYLRYTLQVEGRDGLMDFARSRGIMLGDWYTTPLAPLGVSYDLVGYMRDCPNAERLALTSINLPTHVQMSDEDVARIIAVVKEWSARPVREIVDKKVWDEFVDAAHPSTFLHAFAWGEAERQNGRKVYRLGVYVQGRLQALCVAVIVRARRGNLLLCPHGPICASGAVLSEVMPLIQDELIRIGKAENCVVVRISSILINGEPQRKIFKDLGFRRSPIHVYPELSWILDITADEETLLAGMKKNTRYGIRKAERDGVTVTSSDKAEDFELFWKIYIDTASRQSFVPHPEKLVRGEFEFFSRDARARLYFAHHDGKPISTAFIVYGKDSAFYHHGASLPHTAITPGELLQWRIIQDAKARGLSRYNFWGVVPEGEKDHAWARLDKFKRGFGGAEEAYVPTQDYPLSAKYLMLWIIETARRLKRRV